MNKVNKIVFSREQYGDKLWEVVSQQLQILLKNEEVCTIYDDDTDVIVIEFEHDNRRDYWGSTNPYWLTPKQAELVAHVENKENE